jgi:hypothetical protein
MVLKRRHFVIDILISTDHGFPLLSDASNGVAMAYGAFPLDDPGRIQQI